MRDAVKEIYGAVDRIDDPFVLTVRRGGRTFFAEHRVAWEMPKQGFCDEVLRAFVELKLDVVRFFGVHDQLLAKMHADQIAGLSPGLGSCLQKLVHTVLMHSAGSRRGK